MYNYAAATNYLKTNYVDNEFLYDQFRGVDPMWERLLAQRESGQASGESITFPVAVARSAYMGGKYASVHAQAQATNTAVKREKFVVPFNANVYAKGFVGHKAIYATKDGQGAFVEAIEDETTQVIDSLRSKMSKDVYGDGSAALAKVSSVSGTAVVITNHADLWYIEPGMFIDVYNGLAASATRRGSASVEVTKVNWVTKTLTLSAAPSGIAADDYIFLQGDGNAAAGINTFIGLKGWIPGTAPGATDSFYGVNRSNYVQRLAGWRVSALSTSGTMLETIRRAAVQMSSEWRNAKDKKIDNLPLDCFLHPAAWEVLADEYDDVTAMRRINTNDLATGTKGFTGLQIQVSGKIVNVWACPALNPLEGWLLNMKHWGLKWLGGSAKMPVAFQTMTNGTYFKDVDGGIDSGGTTPGIEFRMQLHPIMFCKSPGSQCYLNLANISTDINAYFTA